MTQARIQTVMVCLMQQIVKAQQVRQELQVQQAQRELLARQVQ